VIDLRVFDLEPNGPVRQSLSRSMILIRVSAIQIEGQSGGRSPSLTPKGSKNFAGGKEHERRHPRIKSKSVCTAAAVPEIRWDLEPALEAERLVPMRSNPSKGRAVPIPIWLPRSGRDMN
jgi:hypothetical protein